MAQESQPFDPSALQSVYRAASSRQPPHDTSHVARARHPLRPSVTTLIVLHVLIVLNREISVVHETSPILCDIYILRTNTAMTVKVPAAGEVNSRFMVRTTAYCCGFCGLFLSRYVARYSIGFGGLHAHRQSQHHGCLRFTAAVPSQAHSLLPLFDQLGHALQQNGHNSLVQVCANGQRLDVHLVLHCQCRLL